MTLQEILSALIRRWKLIVFGAVFTAVVALVISFAMSPTYEATSTMVIAKATVSISFGGKLRTTSEEEQAFMLRRSEDLEARRKALIALVSNATIAGRVVEQLKDQLPEELRKPSRLIAAIEGEAEGDAIYIRAHAGDPDLAAIIANAWAEEYEKHINSIYGTTAGGETLSSVQAETERALEEYTHTQDALEQFIAQNQIDEITRQIQEKKSIISSLGEAKQEAVRTVVDTGLEASSRVISAYTNAQADNLLFAFQQEQKAKEQLLSEYFSAELENRLLALNKDRELRKKLFTNAVDNEIENYMLALQKDRELRKQEFISLADTQIQAMTAVFSQQISDKTQALANAYAKRRSIQQLLDSTQTLLQQVQDGGTQAASASTSLSVILLKAQAVSIGNLPGGLELSVGSVERLSSSTQEQVRGLTALANAFEQQINNLNQSIDEQSEALLKNEGYDFLGFESEQENALSKAISARYQELFDLGELPEIEPEEGNALSQAVFEHYQELFDFGELEQLGQQNYSDSSLLETIQAKYPELFQIGDIAKLSEMVSKTNPLASSATDVSRQLLQLRGFEDIPGYTAAAEPLAEAIDKLDSEVNAFQAKLEGENARHKELLRSRDLAWEKYDILATKVTEVDLASSVIGREVSFASQAFSPVSPVSPKKKQNTLLGFFAGLILSMGFVLIIEHPAVKSLIGPKAEQDEIKTEQNNHITARDDSRNE